MKYLLLFTLASLSLPSAFSYSAEGIKLYTQGCLPYIDDDGTFVFNCEEEEEVTIKLKQISKNPKHFEGNWFKNINKDGTSFVISISLSKTIFPDLPEAVFIIGASISDQSSELTTISQSFNKSGLSASLIHYSPIGVNLGLPHFHFGTSSDSEFSRRMKMENSLRYFSNN